MKALLALALALFVAGCAGTRVVSTEVATGAANPKAIYIRPFALAAYSNPGNPNGAVRMSQAPVEFARILQQELAKLAPAEVLQEDEIATEGWLVEGELTLVDAGNPGLRNLPLFGSLGRAGASCIKVHVRVTELSPVKQVSQTSKGTGPVVTETVYGRVIYEFDVAGGSRATGRFGGVAAPGLGDAVPFDFRNAAERIMLALSPDPFRYGDRFTPNSRN